MAYKKKGVLITEGMVLRKQRRYLRLEAKNKENCIRREMEKKMSENRSRNIERITENEE